MLRPEDEMRIATACGLVLLFPVLTIAEPRITIRVADLAKVPRDTIRKAQRYTAGIFSKAGVGIDWVDCSFEGNERVLASRCQRDLGLNEYWLLLELRKPPRSTGDMLAYADEGGGARQVGIYIPAVRETAATYHAEFFQIMGA